MRRLILGTAGHIDHGKTALVRALTGIDTDRLPEEKRRGITIDLGFASMVLSETVELGIVDVPGHEAFVRNMLAGATGLDLVLLVVAADEGVMPQTREHAAIVDLLGVTRGVVALTKSDLADAEWLDLVREDVEGLLAHTGLRGAPVINVSARTGAGLDELRQALLDAAAAAPDRDARDLFRMPIDRVFTVRGTGTVVTGTVWSGALRRDEQVRVEPAGFTARVRGLQRHGSDCDEVRAGERAAIALAGIDRARLTRGDTLLTAPVWEPAATLTVRLSVLDDAGAPLRARQRVRVSLGTAEVLARVALPDAEVAPGDSSLAQLRLERPVVARALDRFVVRAYSPVRTIAGGVVLEPAAPRRKRLGAVAAPLSRIGGVAGSPAGDPVHAVVELAGPAGVVLADLPLLTGLPPHRIDGALAAADPALRTVADRVLAVTHYAACRDAVLHAIAAHHAAVPLDDGCDREVLRRTASAEAPAFLFEAVLHDLVRSGKLTVRGSSVALADHVTRPHPDQIQLLQRLRDHYSAAALQAPDLGELPAGLNDPATPALLRLLEKQGTLVKLAGTRWICAAALRSGISALRAELPTTDPLAVSHFRDVLNLSRKHLIPLLEYLDRCGVTVRTGEVRRLASSNTAPADPPVAAAQAGAGEP